MNYEPSPQIWMRNYSRNLFNFEFLNLKNLIADFNFSISISIQKFLLSLSLVLLLARRTRNKRILNLIVKSWTSVGLRI